MNTTHNSNDGKPTHDWKFGSELGIQPHSKLYSLRDVQELWGSEGRPKVPRNTL